MPIDSGPKKKPSLELYFPVSIPALAVLGCCVLCSAQPVESSLHAADPMENAANITLGQSLIPLYGPWKFHVGDSPISPVTHRPIWADSGFDDSKWESVDLTPSSEPRVLNMEDVEYVPGWTARGHAGYWGYAWYRIRLQLVAKPGEKLALMGPSDVDDAYQVFANGVDLGSFGDFSGSRPVAYYNQPMIFLLPRDRAHGTKESEGLTAQVFAFRVWMEPTVF